MKGRKIVWQIGLLSLLLVGLVACDSSETAAESATAVLAEDAIVAEETAAEEPTTEAIVENQESASEEEAVETVVVENTKLNLNEASGDDFLNTIPGFGNRMVREFQEYRPYISILQFRQEIGKYVDEATVAGYEEYVYVPVDVNESDTATLMQLPGVDETIAETLMAARPFDSNDAFLTALATHVSPEQANAAAGYLTGE